MCGIFGIYYFNEERKVEEKIVVDSTDTMIHRGPDDSGFFIAKNIGLGHRRLSIIDLSNGHQPLFNEDESVTIVYNGEIYNYLELREELLTKGHKFKTKSDTETIIHAYEEWGESCVNKFRGMFAFVIWDERRKQLFVVRDRIGIKPLYYYNDKNVFIFASEIKAILNTGYVQKGVNILTLDSYFSLGYVPGTNTMFRNIFKLLPGHTITIKDKNVSIKKYWDFPRHGIALGSIDEYKEKFYSLFTECVKMRLMSDVPLGVFLSGGLDSSAVVSVMSKMVSDPVKTFSVGYNNAEDISELKYADIIADTFKTDHHTFTLDPKGFIDSLDILLKHMEEPVVESPAIALYHIAKLCKPHATVVLSGEGSDEGFAGYGLYNLMNRINKLKKNISGDLDLFNYIRVPKFLLNERYIKYAEWLFRPLEKVYKGTSADLPESYKKSFYTEDLYKEKGDYLDRVFGEYFSYVRGDNALSKMLYVDAKTWLVDDLLLKADKMTMAASVELRVPFLDHVLMEFATSLPNEYKIKDGQGKYLLKKTMENLLPNSIIYRKKMGFPVPVNQWFGKELNDKARDILLSKKSIQRGYINPDYLTKILGQQLKGKGNHGRRIFSLLNLELWHNMYIDE